MKTEKELNRIGKFLSLVLRHKPKEANLTLDPNGWTDTKSLLKNVNIDLTELDWIVSNDNKERFSYNDNKTKIRANQGHSISEIDLNLDEIQDIPEYLYHGTSTSVLSILIQEGIKKMKRNYIHLSKDIETATIVGKRKGNNIVIIKIDSKQMYKDNIEIYISKNNVYLTDYVNPKYFIEYLY